MTALDRIVARRQAILNQYPLGADITDWDSELGHRDEFSPAKYGSYIATSNLIYSAITLRARRLATIPIRAYQGSDENKKLQPKGPVPDLLQYVNPHWTYPRLKRQTEQCMGLWGEAFWAVQRNKSGAPESLWWVRSDRMHPVPHPTKYLSGFLYEPSTGGEMIPFATDEVIWFRYPNPLDEYAGLSPLAAARLGADTATSSMQANKNLFDKGMQLAGVIGPPKGVTFSESDARTLEHQLERRLSGVDKAHRWAILRFEAQVAQLSVTPRDAEWLGGLNYSVREVSRAYGIPSPLLMDLEHATLANVREFDRMLWELALVPDEEFFVAELREQLLPMFRTVVNHLEPDFSGVAALQEAQSAVWARDRQAMEVGALTINEWRKSKGLPPVPWGEVWWAPVNKGPVATDKDLPAQTANPAGDPDQAAAASAMTLQEEIARMLEEFEPSMNGAGHD